MSASSNDDVTYIVCSLVADVPNPRVPGTEERWCCVCAEPVWMAPSSIVHMLNTGHLPLCPPCALGLAETSKERPIIEGPVPGAQARREFEENQ